LIRLLSLSSVEGFFFPGCGPNALRVQWKAMAIRFSPEFTFRYWRFTRHNAAWAK
jgi:hypothetical protein